MGIDLQICKENSTLWKRFTHCFTNHNLAQVLLLGPRTADLIELVYKMATSILCLQSNPPCLQCQSCYLIQTNNHPDLINVLPGANKLIGIEQIRALSGIIFRSPQLSKERVVIINNACQMNDAAANCLLKMLEEPPPNINFFLLAEQISTILPTVLSRCQNWWSRENIATLEYLTEGEKQALTPSKKEIFEQILNFIQDLANLKKDNNLICDIAAKWSKFDFVDVLWLVYLLNAQMISCQLYGEFLSPTANWLTPVKELSQYFYIMTLFKQLDCIVATLKKINSHINLNKTIALENLLLGYV